MTLSSATQQLNSFQKLGRALIRPTFVLALIMSFAAQSAFGNSDEEILPLLEPENFASEEAIQQTTEKFPFTIFQKTVNLPTNPGVPIFDAYGERIPPPKKDVYIIIYADASHQMPITSPLDAAVGAQHQYGTWAAESFFAALGFMYSFDAYMEMREFDRKQDTEKVQPDDPQTRPGFQTKINQGLAVAAGIVGHIFGDRQLRKSYGHTLPYRMIFYGGHQRNRSESNWIAGNLNQAVTQSVERLETMDTFVFPVLPLHFSYLANSLKRQGFYEISPQYYLSRSSEDSFE